MRFLSCRDQIVHNNSKGAAMEKTLQEEFEYVRKTFFPRWDRKREWKIQFVEELSGDPDLVAWSSLSTKTITILRSKCPVGDHLRAVLIHEICHAISSRASQPLGHGKYWCDRMQDAVETASRLRLIGVAKEIARDIYHWKILHRRLSNILYELIEDRATKTEDDFFTVIDRVMPLASEDQEGFYKPEPMTRRRFLRKYPLAEEAYQQGKAVRARHIRTT